MPPFESTGPMQKKCTVVAYPNQSTLDRIKQAVEVKTLQFGAFNDLNLDTGGPTAEAHSRQLYASAAHLFYREKQRKLRRDSLQSTSALRDRPIGL